MSYFSPSGSGGASSGSVGLVRSQFSTALAVPPGSNALLISYTVPPTRTVCLMRIEVSGTNIATYDVLLNGAPLARARTYWSNPTGVIHLGGSVDDAYRISEGDTLSIQVTNFRPTSGDFEARLQFIELP